MTGTGEHELTALVSARQAEMLADIVDCRLLAEAFGWSPSYVRRLCRERRIPFMRANGKGGYRFSLRAVERALSKRPRRRSQR